MFFGIRISPSIEINGNICLSGFIKNKKKKKKTKTETYNEFVWLQFTLMSHVAKKRKKEQKKERKENKGQCTTGPTATTVQSSKQLIVKLHAKNTENSGTGFRI